MDEYGYDLKIPKERVAVLIGKNGEIKKAIEEYTKTKLNIDSKEGDVSVTGEDAITIMDTLEIIKAIGRGFNPDIAMLLLKKDYMLEIINIGDYAKTTKSLERIKGRIIGREGKSRKVIEELTECYLCIYGKTVSIIGLVEFTQIAKRAISMLLQGSPHSNVYHYLERQRRSIKQFKAIGTMDFAALKESKEKTDSTESSDETIKNEEDIDEFEEE